MATAPPTDAEIDTFMNSDTGDGINFAAMFNMAQSPVEVASLAGSGDTVIWVVAYTDNAGGKHFEGFPPVSTGETGSSDSELEATSPPVSDGGGPYTSPDMIQLMQFQALPYLRWLIEAYGAIRLRGYILPTVPWPTPLSDTIHTAVNDVSSWPAAS
jgi:hypothetical protein